MYIQSVCLPTNTTLSIIDDSRTDKFVLNGDSTYDTNRKYGLINGTYTFTGIPKEHPIAILNDGQPINYSPINDPNVPIIIKVAGGQTDSANPENEDYYIFTDANDNVINIGGNDAKYIKIYER